MVFSLQLQVFIDNPRNDQEADRPESYEAFQLEQVGLVVVADF